MQTHLCFLHCLHWAVQPRIEFHCKAVHKNTQVRMQLAPFPSLELSVQGPQTYRPICWIPETWFQRPDGSPQRRVCQKGSTASLQKQHRSELPTTSDIPHTTPGGVSNSSSYFIKGARRNNDMETSFEGRWVSALSQSNAGKKHIALSHVPKGHSGRVTVSPLRSLMKLLLHP